MDILVSVVAKILEYTVAPIGRQLGYLFRYTTIIKTLEEKVENLEYKRGEMQSRVTNARRNGEEIFLSVIKWLDDVNAFLVDSNKFLNQDIKTADRKCIKGLCPNLSSLYQLSRKAEKKMKDAEELMKGNIFTQISEYVQEPPIEFAPTEDSMDFKSREEILNEIWASLKGNHIRMIGIYGMPGVGKTTLVKQVGKLAESSSLFDVILLTVVSQNPNFLYIQDRFAELIGLKKFDEKTKEGRASRLHGILEKRLKAGEKILVILDDVWEDLKMSDLGIPFSYDDSKFQTSCKIVVTSRNENVCRQMGSQTIYKVEPLHQDEAWSLFERIVGHETLNSTNRRPIASEIIKACGGLPLAINIIASALRNNDSLDCWKDAIGKIRKGNLDQKVFTALELSYKFLIKESDAQELFLLCNLFREDADIPIYDLLLYGLGWGFFQNNTTLESAIVRIHALVEYLKSSSLLLDGTNQEFVKMHDVVREFALSVASKDHHMFSMEAGSIFDNFASNDSFKLCSSISLQIKDANYFPSKLEVPELKLLKLERGFDGPPLVLPYDMIAPMQKLKVLSMYGIQILSLPVSFKYFQELHTLSFDSCEINDISIIGDLKNLFFLRFRGCNIRALPKEVGKLTRLKILDLSNCKELTLVPSNIIRNLSRLEGLLMGYFGQWAVPSEDNGNNGVSLEELKCLSNLVLLDVHIPDTKLWHEDLLYKNLRRFKISLGGQFEERETLSGSSKILKFNHVTCNPLIKGADVLLQTAEVIFIENMNGFQNGLYDLGLTCFSELKCLHIKNLREMKYVANATIARCEVFPRLEILEISYLYKLEEMSHGKLQRGSFCKLHKLRLKGLRQLISIWKSPAESAPLCNLRILTISGCGKLKSIFPQSMVRYLLQLVELKVEDCEPLEEIIDCENESEVPDIVFQQLRILWLTDLPSLKSFFSLVNPLAGDNHHASHIQVVLFGNKVSFPKLEDLLIENLESLREIWTSQCQLQLSFPRLRKLRISNLPNLIHVWNMGSKETIRFQSLSSLEVASCPMMEVVVATEENATTLIEFSCLQTIELEDLSNFKSFYTGRSTLFDEKVVVPELGELSLSGLSKLWHVWENLDQHRTHLSFQQLYLLQISDCHNLTTVLLASTTGSLQQHQEEKTVSCDRTKTIEAGDEQEEGNSKNMIVFPALQELDLYELPNLTSFFTGQNTLFDEKVAFPFLEILRLKELDNIEYVWCYELPVKCFSPLKKLKVDYCLSLLHVAPFHFLQALQNVIEHFTLRKCWFVEKLFELEGVAVEKRKTTLTFSRLKTLKVKGLRELEYLFDEEVAFPALEKLEVSSLDNVRDLWCSQLPLQSFGRLKHLKVSRCDELVHVIPSYLAQPLLNNMEHITVKRCNSMEELVELQGFAVDERKATPTFHRLRSLELRRNNPKLEYLFDKKVSFPAIEKLLISGMEGLMEIWQIQLPPRSFHRLQIIKVSYCDKLQSIIPLNLFQNMEGLQALSVKSCKAVEEIIGDAGGGLEHTKVLVPHLQSVKLRFLPMLKSFCHHTCDFECPSLTEVDLLDCHKMETFTYGNLKTPKLKSISFGCDEQWLSDLNSTIGYAYQERQKDDNNGNDSDKSEGSSDGTTDNDDNGNDDSD